MYVKIHKTGNPHGHQAVIAVCDASLLGKTLREGTITLAISEGFYKGEKKTENEVIAILKQATNVNLVGKEAVNAGLRAGIIEKESILTIEGVPHAQSFAF